MNDDQGSREVDSAPESAGFSGSEGGCQESDSDRVDDRHPIVVAIDRASEVITACLVMVLPGVGGFFLDQSMKTGVVFTLLGVALGVGGGTVLIIRVVGKNSGASNFPSKRDPFQ